MKETRQHGGFRQLDLVSFPVSAGNRRAIGFIAGESDIGAVQTEVSSSGRPISSPQHRTTLASGMGFVIFIVLTSLVQMRILAPLDTAMVRAVAEWRSTLFKVDPFVWQSFDFASMAISVLCSTELMAFYAVVGSVLLGRAGCGRWSVTPYAFVLLVWAEVILKLTVHQPPMGLALSGVGFIPPQYGPSYPLLSVPLGGSFPSGHASRFAFLATFVVIHLWERDGRAKKLRVLLVIALMLFVGFTRVYVRDHWPSDVVGGLALGAALALLVAPHVARQLAAVSPAEREVKPYLQ